MTCGTCTSTCKDLHADCPGWTAGGECNKNAAHMYMTCPHSCNACKSNARHECHDFNATQCDIWAKAAECHTNPEVVIPMCPSYARARGSPPPARARACTRRRARARSLRALTRGPLRRCAVLCCAVRARAVVCSSCGVCTTVCIDRDESCHSWAVSGECEKAASRAFMAKTCPQACGTCHELEKLGATKEEL